MIDPKTRYFFHFLKILVCFLARKKNGQCTPGRIVVHDRARVEAEILPRYFNHASFASLRRQLNYFAFSRVGKGKQKGATYCNENVVEIMDILRLKRRAVGSTIPVVQEKKFEVTPEASPAADMGEKKESSTSLHSTNTVSTDSKSNVAVTMPNNVTKKKRKRKTTSKKTKKIIDSLVPVVHLPQKKSKVSRSTSSMNDGGPSNNNKTTAAEIEKSGFSVSISPPPAAHANVSQRTSTDPQITLDLTQPPSFMNYSICTTPQGTTTTHNTREADILAGCSALLALGYQPSV